MQIVRAPLEINRIHMERHLVAAFLLDCKQREPYI